MSRRAELWERDPCPAVWQAPPPRIELRSSWAPEPLAPGFGADLALAFLALTGAGPGAGALALPIGAGQALSHQALVSGAGSALLGAACWRCSGTGACSGAVFWRWAGTWLGAWRCVLALVHILDACLASLRVSCGLCEHYSSKQ
eukprot:gene16986-biopygen6769